MIRQVEKFLDKLASDRTGRHGRMAVLAHDDTIIGRGAEDLRQLGERLLEQLNVQSIALVEPTLPFSDRLIAAADPAEHTLLPRDTETRTFLHDIPFLRRSELAADPAGQIARHLANRKGILVEGLGIIATGAFTPEQAYINVSSIFHSTFVKYLLDLLHKPARTAADDEALGILQNDWLRDLEQVHGAARPASALTSESAIYKEIAAVGRMTVQLGLVDSFFGNISCAHDGTIYISQTGASLDELEGCIDPVPFDNSSTCGITASSELLAHRQVYLQTGAQTLLHGHPKFAVIMSMLCENAACTVKDCWRDCPHIRQVGDIPIVAGEVGAGGLAEKISPVIGRQGRVIVFGHGVFAIGYNGFIDALEALIETERWCRHEYFRRLKLTVD